MRPRRLLLTRREREQRQRRSRWRLVLLGGAVVLVAYYGLVVTSMRGQDSSAVSLDNDAVDHPKDRITLEVEAADLDPSSGSFDVRVRPVPHGEFEARNGELSRPLQLEVSSPGEQPTSFDFPAITVAVIGGAVARGRVDFAHVIWLGAMLVAIPAVRNEMPGVPPIGTAVDLFIFFPSMVIVGVALLAGVAVLAVLAVLAVNEATGATVGVEDL
jgi:hypothetical protein